MGLEKIKRKKKGFLFTAGAIMLLSLLLLSYGVYDLSKQDEEAVKKRVKTLDNFVFSLEKDLPRQVYASGFRIIFLLEKKIVDTGNYTDDIHKRFKEAFYNGTINNEPQIIMTGVTYQDIIDSINEKAEKINAKANFTNSSFIVNHETPWEVKVTLKGNLIIEDVGGLAKWNRTEEIEAYISIDTFEDPVYIVSTNGLITNRFNQTPYENFTEGNDVSNLENHLENSYYKNNSNAPNFLQRLEGNFSASPNGNGIESLVYLPELSNAGVSVESKSCVDYIYFSSNNPSSNQVNGMPTWFKLDNQDNHHEIYNVTGLIV